MSATADHALTRLELGLIALVGAATTAAAALYPLWRERLVIVCPAWALLGIPCPTCGATRAVTALVRGDLLVALSWNPAAALGAAALIVVALLAAVAAAGLCRAPRLPVRLHPALTAAFFGALLANWVYLLLTFSG